MAGKLLEAVEDPRRLGPQYCNAIPLLFDTIIIIEMYVATILVVIVVVVVIDTMVAVIFMVNVFVAVIAVATSTPFCTSTRTKY